jgi:hypothetical protein
LPLAITCTPATLAKRARDQSRHKHADRFSAWVNPS